MASAPCITVNLPDFPLENLRTVLSVALLRLIASVTLEDGDKILTEYQATAGDQLGNIYYWSPSSTADDDGASVIRPFDLLPLQAGRWIGVLPRPTSLAYTYPLAGAVARTIPAKVGELNVTPEDFGATGVEGDDQSAALALFTARMGPGVVGRLGRRTYRFSSPLVMPVGNNGTVQGENRYDSRLLYVGDNAGIDLLTLGATDRETRGWALKNFMVDSLTSMTAGYAVRTVKTIFCEYDMPLTGFYGPGGDGLRDYTGVKLWNGYYFEGFLYNHLHNIDIKVRNDGVSARGFSTGYNAQLIMNSGQKIAAGRTGLHLGGGCGGVLLDEVDIIGCGQDNILIDTSLTAQGNNQIFFGPQASLDQAGRDNLRVDDSLGGFQSLQIESTWSASALGCGIHIINWGNPSSPGSAQIRGGRITNNQSHGVWVETNTPFITMLGGIVDGNVGRGVYSTIGGGVTKPFCNFRVADVTCRNNTGGNWEGLINGWPDTTYRRDRTAGTTSTATPTTDFTVAHGYNTFGGFQLARSIISANAWYYASSGTRVALTIVSCSDTVFTLRGSSETGRPVYIDFTFTADEGLI